MKAADVMEDVVAELVTAMETGASDWSMPWRNMGTAGWPTNAATRNRYSGGNALYFAVVAIQHGYPSRSRAT